MTSVFRASFLSTGSHHHQPTITCDPAVPLGSLLLGSFINYLRMESERKISLVLFMIPFIHSSQGSSQKLMVRLASAKKELSSIEG